MPRLFRRPSTLALALLVLAAGAIGPLAAQDTSPDTLSPADEPASPATESAEVSDAPAPPDDQDAAGQAPDTGSAAAAGGIGTSIDGARSDPLDPSTLQSLKALHQALASKEQQTAEVQQQLVEARDQVTREELAKQLRELRAELADDRRQFDRFALEIDLSPFVEEKEESFDWQDELSNLLQPILAELKSATAESRAIGELRNKLETIGKRKELAGQAVQRLQSLLQQEPSPSLRERLEARLDYWQRIANETSNRYTALDLQLQNKLEQRESVFDETASYARRFVQTRGLNLLLAVGAFCLVFFGVRWVASQIMRRRKPDAEQQFGSRLTLLLLHAFSILGGLLAMMAVFNAAGDWFMLGLIIIFLLGVGWASIKTLPGQIESVKLILNVGTVREGERILFDEVPYRVDSLAFRAKLVNPALEGGVQQLPVRDLVGYHSRPAGQDEAWFPTRRGDWVELNDGLLGQVTHQRPSAVRLSDLGGAEIVSQPPLPAAAPAPAQRAIPHPRALTYRPPPPGHRHRRGAPDRGFEDHC